MLIIKALLLLNGDTILIKDILKKPFLLSVSVFSLIACLLRIILLKSNTEIGTGFYINPASFTRILFIIVIILAFLFGFAWTYLVKKRGVLPVNLKFDFTNLFSERIIMGIVTVGFAVNTFYEIFRMSHPMYNTIVNKSTVLFTILAILASIASLIYFIMISFLYENNNFARSLFCVTPIVWIIFRLLKDFISFTAITTVSKNLLDIVYLSVLLITLFSLGRIFTESESAKAIKLYNITAPITIILGFVLSIPAIIGLIFSFETIGESDIFMHLVDLALSVYLLRTSMYIYSEN